MAPIRAWAGPPYDTDDPEPVDYQHWEAYVASQDLRGRDGASGTGPHFEVNYGAAPNVQLHLIAPLVYDKPSDASFQYGYGDTELGVKYRFLTETSTRPMAGVFPLVELPTGDSSKGLGNGATQLFLPVWIQKSFGAWSTYGGGGYWRNPGAGNRDYWFFGWQAQRQVSKQCSIGAEIFNSTPSAVDGTSHLGFNVGTIYDFDDGHHFLFSIGRDLHGSNQAAAYIAFQWTFGPHEEKGVPTRAPLAAVTGPMELRDR